MGPARLGYEFHALVQVHYWGTVTLGLLRGSFVFRHVGSDGDHRECVILDAWS